MKRFLNIMSNSLEEVTMLFILNNNIQININKYPDLNDLGYWVPTKSESRLLLRTKLPQPTVAKRFQQITKLSAEDFDMGVVSSINDVW